MKLVRLSRSTGMSVLLVCWGAISAALAANVYVAVGNEVRVYDSDTFSLVDVLDAGSTALSVDLGPDGRVYAGKFSGLVAAIDPDTNTLVNLGGGHLAGAIYGTTVSAAGIIYASGSGMPEVRTMNLAGVPQPSIVSPNGSNLRSTSFGPDGSFYLTSFGGGPGQHWDPGFAYVGAFGGGGLSSAFGVGTRSNGDVIIVSQNNDAYYIFDLDTAFIQSVSIASCANQERNLAVDSGDNVWITCHGQQQVVKFSPSDVELGRFSVPGNPSGVAVAPLSIPSVPMLSAWGILLLGVGLSALLARQAASHA